MDIKSLIRKLNVDNESYLAGKTDPKEGKKRKIAAVAVIFMEMGNEPGILFTKRSACLGEHAGQISFPGGAVEADDISYKAAALRETQEEIGIEAEELEILASLPCQPVLDCWLIYPFAAWWAFPRTLKPNPGEVEKIIISPLRELYEQHSEDCWAIPDPIQACRYQLTEDTLWGATARITGRLLDRLKISMPPTSWRNFISAAADQY